MLKPLDFSVRIFVTGTLLLLKAATVVHESTPRGGATTYYKFPCNPTDPIEKETSQWEIKTVAFVYTAKHRTVDLGLAFALQNSSGGKFKNFIDCYVEIKSRNCFPQPAVVDCHSG